MSLSMDVARSSDLSRRDFAREYLLPSPRPVILTGALSSWKALGKWTPDYFGETEAEFLARAREAYRAGAARWLERGCLKLHDSRELEMHCDWLIRRRVYREAPDVIAARDGILRDDALEGRIKRIYDSTQRLARLIGLPGLRRGRPKKLRVS